MRRGAFRSLTVAALLVFEAGVGVAQSPLTASCAPCHPAEVKLHEQTRMAHAMVPAFESAFFLNLPDGPLRESGDGFLFTYQRDGTGVKVTSTRGQERAEGIIEWVLGAGAQGQTPLIRTASGTLESRVSYFSRVHQYGITVDQVAGSSANAGAALGLHESGRGLEACIGCHASAISSDLQPVIPGVQCQRCHLGADAHARGSGKLPLNPGKLAPLAQVRFCGNCHRFQKPPDAVELETVRFQPLQLMKSRCFGSGKLACTTCHEAHRDARRNDAAYYNEKCRACHDGRAMHTDARRTGNCIGCHMPRVQIHPALQFTDHFIRVVRPGSAP